MKKAEVIKYLDNSFRSKILKEYKKAKYSYVKVSNELYYSFGFAIVDLDNSFPTTFRFGIGSKKVKAILELVLPEKYKAMQENEYPPAIHFGQIVLFDEGKYPILEYDIYTEADAQKMVDEVSHYLLSNVLPEWEANPTNEYLEKTANESLSDSPNFSGLILAKLVGSSNYETVKAHFIKVSKDWSDWDRNDLEKVIDFLDNHSQEELLKIAEG
jgi:hypothetical protein